MKQKCFMAFSWTRRDSNPRSLRCERSAFPTKLRAHFTKKSQKNGGNGARTHDLSRVRRTLSRLSYVSMTSILPHFLNLTRGKFTKLKKNWLLFSRVCAFTAQSKRKRIANKNCETGAEYADFMVLPSPPGGHMK